MWADIIGVLQGGMYAVGGFLLITGGMGILEAWGEQQGGNMNMSVKRSVAGAGIMALAFFLGRVQDPTGGAVMSTVLMYLA